MQTRNLNKYNPHPAKPKKAADPVPLNKVLMQNQLGYLVKKAQRLIRLDHLVKECLPAELQHRCQVINCIGPNLILGVTDNTVATKIRFMSAEIIQDLKASYEQHGHNAAGPISAIRVKVKLR